MILLINNNKQLTFIRKLILTFLLALPVSPAMADGDTLTGDWNGARKRMAEKGVSLDISYIGDYGTNLSGGASTGSTYLDDTLIELGIDGDKMGMNGAGFHFSVLGNQGQTPSPSTMVGDAQGVSNIEAPNKWQLYEAWYEQKFSERFSTKLGIYDFNGDFDVVDTAGLFLNGAHGIGTAISQTGPPLFPDIFPAVYLGYSMDNGRYLQTAYMVNTNSSPNDTMLGIEYGKTIENASTGLLKYGLGVLYFTSTSTTDAVGNPIAATNNYSVYALLETALIREAGKEGQGLNGFLRYSVADPKLNQFASFLGAGLVYTGLFNGRDEDQLGLAIAIANNGDTYKAGTATATAAETNIELSYRFQIKPWFAIQPDLQYIMDPGADNSNAAATYFAVRAEIIL